MARNVKCGLAMMVPFEDYCTVRDVVNLMEFCCYAKDGYVLDEHGQKITDLNLPLSSLREPLSFEFGRRKSFLEETYLHVVKTIADLFAVPEIEKEKMCARSRTVLKAVPVEHFKSD